jgi:hypothetical protein
MNDIQTELSEQKNTSARLEAEVANLKTSNSFNLKELKEIKNLQSEVELLLKKIENKQESIQNLVYIGFIFLGFTALGIAISFLNLVVDVYTFINSKL